MKYKRLTIHDSDRHVVEDPNLWEEYLPEEIFSQYPVKVVHDTPVNASERLKSMGARAAVPLPPIYSVAEKSALSNWTIEHQIESAYKSGRSVENRRKTMTGLGQLESMDIAKVSSCSLFPTFATFIINNENIPPFVSVEYAKAYNRWILDYCDGYQDRLKPAAVISRADSDYLVEQLNLAIKQGFSSITLRPEIINGKTLGHSDYVEFWEVCSQSDIAVSFHGGTHAHLQTCGTDRFSSHFSLHACSHPMEAQMAFVSLLESGVLERHPDLKFAFLEAGASWVPHWLWRLDNICYPEFPSLVQENIKMLPSEYFKRQCWVAVELGEPCLREVINTIGHKKLLYGTDFPHPDHLHFSTEDIAKHLSELTRDELSDVLANNAKDFFGFSSESIFEADLLKVNM